MSLSVTSRSVEQPFLFADGVLTVEPHTCELSDGTSCEIAAFRMTVLTSGEYAFFYSRATLIDGNGWQTQTPFMIMPSSGDAYDAFMLSDDHALLEVMTCVGVTLGF